MFEDVLVPSAFEVYGGKPPKVSLPDYARFVSARSGMPKFEGVSTVPVELGEEKDMSKADFADSAVATVKLKDFRPWITDEEWQEVVEPFTDAEVWLRKVLSEDWEDHAVKSHATCREPRLTVRQQQQLFEKGYVRRVRRGRFWCTVFAVWKSDGVTIRLIWNGKAFNAACRPPPSFSITPLPGMLRRLLHPDVAAFLAYDATTWFLQFDIEDGIAQYFGTKLWGGRQVALRGVPMGAAWACALAQTMTIALARAVEERLRKKDVRPVAWEFCIDNTIVALRDGSEVAVVKEVVREVAGDLHVVLKESAFDEGDEVDWLVYRLSASRRRAMFKEAFIDKLRKAVVNVERWYKEGGTVHDAWTAGGLVMFVRFAASTSMKQLGPLMRWMASNTPSTLAGWAATADGMPWEVVVRVLRGAADKTEVHPPPSPVEVVRAWFVTDASTTGSNAIVLVVGNRLTLEVYPCEGRPRIEARELHAHVRACVMAVAAGAQDGYVVGYGDNVVALVAQRRGHAVWADDSLAQAVETTRSVMDRRRLVLVAPYVATDRCLADVWTRVPGLSIQREWVCSGQHVHAPGVLCKGMEAELVGWMAEGDGGEEKLRKWKEEEGEWIVTPMSDPIKSGALTRTSAAQVKYKM